MMVSLLFTKITIDLKLEAIIGWHIHFGLTEKESSPLELERLSRGADTFHFYVR
jgi:hypothetical protein